MRSSTNAILWLACWLLPNVSQCWTTAPRWMSVTNQYRRSGSALKDASEGEGERELDFKRKMAMVRSLQMTYYRSNNFTHSSLDPKSGMIYDLPLWRAPWTELPGRSNMLNVHDPVYTNMFESILYKEKPWYIGHLYLPDGSANLKTDNPAMKLKSWEGEIQDVNKTYPRSAVIGTLLKIADYRRMEDGRLLLLVEALERFVVTNVKQELPYSIADVQLLPDTEEVDPDFWVEDSTEGEIREARSMALAESFQRYHPYEYDENFELPIPDKKDLQIADIHGSMLTLVLPYVPLSKTADLSKLKEKPLELESKVAELEEAISKHLVDEGRNNEEEEEAAVTDEQPCLEQQLLEGSVLKEFSHQDETVMELSSAQLEYKLWVAINDYLKSTKTPVSPVLLGLLPHDTDWPKGFHLRKIADDIAKRTDLKHNFVQVSPLLPSHRRLRRLSYSATTLLEKRPGMEHLRQKLLETASTKERLAMILEILESYNSELWGEFE
jgi:Lon protease-like protein